MLTGCNPPLFTVPIAGLSHERHAPVSTLLLVLARTPLHLKLLVSFPSKEGAAANTPACILRWKLVTLIGHMVITCRHLTVLLTSRTADQLGV